MMKSSSPTKPDSVSTLSLTFPCNLISVERARKTVAGFILDPVCVEEARDLILATQEALKNVVEHACPVDNRIHAECILARDRIIVEVRDRGRGFDVESRLRNPPGPMCDHGRGLVLIRNLLDNVSITSDANGTIVHMEKPIEHGQPYCGSVV